MADVMIVGEIIEGKLSASTNEVLGAARKLADDLGQKVVAVVLGSGIGDAANEAISFGADKVYTIDNEMFAELGFSSWHPGGCHFAMVDGSVHFFTTEMELAILQALATRAGGETIDADY